MEALIWLIALTSLALISFPPDQQHFSLCPLYNLGFDFCPGCGLGKSISLLLHGKFSQSITTHPLGVFALVILSLRIIKLIKLYVTFYGTNS
jgi:hypothetical protein